MAYTVYEYSNLTQWGEPIEPPNVRTVAQAFDTPLHLQPDTVYVAIVPAADMRLRVGGASTDTVAATDHKIVANDGRGFYVRKGAAPWIDGIAG